MNSGKHLAIVRAALTYWNEEMASVDQSVYKHYLHSKDEGHLFTAQHVAEAKSYFEEVEWKFALIDVVTTEFVSSKPVDTLDELSYSPVNQLQVVVLVRKPKSDKAL